MKEEGFGRYNLYDNPSVTNIIVVMVHNMKEQLHPAIPKKTMKMAIIF